MSILKLTGKTEAQEGKLQAWGSCYSDAVSVYATSQQQKFTELGVMNVL